MKTATDLWQRLQAQGLVGGSEPPEPAPSTPWFVRIMLGFAGWLAAAFLLGFIGLAFGFVFEDDLLAFIVGAALIGPAYGCFRAASHNEFTAQFGLALSFTGQALIAFSLFSAFEWESAVAWYGMALVELVLVLVLPNFLHRVWSAYAGTLLVAIALSLDGFYVLTPSLVAVAVAAVLSNESRWVRWHSLANPVGYGLVLALIHVSDSLFWRPGLHSWLDRQTDSYVSPWYVSPWIGELLVAAVFLEVVWRLLAYQGLHLPQRNAVLAMAAAVLISLFSLKAPGLAASGIVILLGYHAGNRVLVGLGGLSFLFYLSAYYYLLDLTLLTKSLVLIATGILLLAVRWCLNYLLTSKEARSHA